MSIKEQIALRRAEALKKAKSGKSSIALEDQSPIDIAVTAAEEDILGRWSIRDTIDRAKSSGMAWLLPLEESTTNLIQVPSF